MLPETFAKAEVRISRQNFLAIKMPMFGCGNLGTIYRPGSPESLEFNNNFKSMGSRRRVIQATVLFPWNGVNALFQEDERINTLIKAPADKEHLVQYENFTSELARVTYHINTLKMPPAKESNHKLFATISENSQVLLYDLLAQT